VVFSVAQRTDTIMKFKARVVAGFTQRPGLD
jgi:hypothetical protein